MSRKQIIERILILIVPPIISLLGVLYFRCQYNKNALDIYSMAGIDGIKTMLSVYATLLGFSITAESILVTFQGGEYTKIIIKAGHLETVLFSFMLTNISLFMSLVWYILKMIYNQWYLSIYYTFIVSLIMPLSYLAISILYFFMMLSSSKK